jgi:hypothetical protein
MSLRGLFFAGDVIGDTTACAGASISFEGEGEGREKRSAIDGIEAGEGNGE